MTKLIFLLFLALSLCAATPPAKSPVEVRVDTLELRVNRQDSALRLESRQLDSLAMIKEYREQSLEDAQKNFQWTLTLLATVLTLSGIIAAWTGISATARMRRLDEKLKNFEEKDAALKSADKLAEARLLEYSARIENLKLEATKLYDSIAVLQETRDKLKKLLSDSEYEKAELSDLIAEAKKWADELAGLKSKVSKHEKSLEELALRIGTVGLKEDLSTEESADIMNAAADAEKQSRAGKSLSFSSAIFYAFVLFTQKKYDDALKAIDLAVINEPNTATLHNFRGIILSAMNNPLKAIESFDEAIRLDKNDPSAYYNRSCANALLSRKEPMLKDLRSAINQDSELGSRAKSDEDFKAYWDDPDFKVLVKD